MKKLLIILDGADDTPCSELGEKTPLEAAFTPNLDFIAAKGTEGSFRTFSDGKIPGSENAILALLGYPEDVYTTAGRAALEAAGMGITLDDSEFAIRCNIVETTSGGNLITDRPADINFDFLENRFSGTFLALKKIGYRITHLKNLKTLAVSKNRFYGHVCIPPHEAELYGIKKWLILPPDSPDSEQCKPLTEIAGKIIEINDGKSSRYFSLWFWGGGKSPRLTPFPELRNIENPVMITGTPLVKGIARAAGIRLAEVKGATGNRNTDYEGKASIAVKELASGADFAIVHIEAPDEAGHEGNPELKKHIIEEIDRRFLGNLLSHIKSSNLGEVEITVTADHPTPCALRRHTAESVRTLKAVIHT